MILNSEAVTSCLGILFFGERFFLCCTHVAPPSPFLRPLTLPLTPSNLKSFGLILV